jgi:HAD superfamily hydrolase (TIGR01662 family)
VIVRCTSAPRRAPAAVLFDRDGTLVVDVPYNGDPAKVRPVPGAGAALDLLRAAGIPAGVVTNQSGVARGLITAGEVQQVNRRIDALLGPFAVWQVCPHGPADGCPCRKPRPGMVLAAAPAVPMIRAGHCAPCGRTCGSRAATTTRPISRRRRWCARGGGEVVAVPYRPARAPMTAPTRS